MNFWKRSTLILWAVAAVAHGEDALRPSFRSMVGGFFVGGDHVYFVESELQLPILQVGPAAASYRYRESTPFLDINRFPQAEQLYTRYELQVDFKLGEQLRLITVGGYHSVHFVDRAGKFDSYVLGAGIGSPRDNDDERLAWQIVAGGYVSRENFGLNWWTDASLSWRVIDFAQGRYRQGDYRPSVALTADIEASNDGDRFRALYKIGPELQFQTAFGNRANLQARWYRNDNNPFYGVDENGLLVGLEFASSGKDNPLLDAREHRQSGWLPLVWGGYDVGASDSRRVSRFEMNVEVVDFLVAEHRLTWFIWYQSRQEHRIGDFDNIAYSASFGFQTPVGLESPLSQSDPLVAGMDFVHRSDHSLNPDAARTAVIGTPTLIGGTTQNLIDNGNINLVRLRLQTIGWDLPYRDPRMYDRKNAWLNRVDWRVTAGVNSGSSRKRGDFAGQLGLNWDVATVQGFVPYLRGVVSAGNETPDWQAEAGVRRPVGKIFARYESYHLSPNLAQGNALVFGFGVNL